MVFAEFVGADYLIVAFARNEGTSMDVGFYYMASAMGSYWARHYPVPFIK